MKYLKRVLFNLFGWQLDGGWEEMSNLCTVPHSWEQQLCYEGTSERQGRSVTCKWLRQFRKPRPVRDNRTNLTTNLTSVINIYKTTKGGENVGNIGQAYPNHKCICTLVFHFLQCTSSVRYTCTNHKSLKQFAMFQSTMKKLHTCTYTVL